jgi:nucleotide-binding universal stress UspA family protein
MIIFGLILAAGMFYAASHLASDLSVEKATTIRSFVMLVGALLIALGFEFVNGFHDTANAVATVIYTHSLEPHVAVDLIKRQESLDREKLTAIAKQHLAGVKCEILDEMGPPADVIAEVAKSLPADLIVMVTHGRRGLARIVEGSIAEKVLRSAPCPVLAVRQDQ